MDIFFISIEFNFSFLYYTLFYSILYYHMFPCLSAAITTDFLQRVINKVYRILSYLK